MNFGTIAKLLRFGYHHNYYGNIQIFTITLDVCIVAISKLPPHQRYVLIIVEIIIVIITGNCNFICNCNCIG